MLLVALTVSIHGGVTEDATESFLRGDSVTSWLSWPSRLTACSDPRKGLALREDSLMALTVHMSRLPEHRWLPSWRERSAWNGRSRLYTTWLGVK